VRKETVQSPARDLCLLLQVLISITTSLSTYRNRLETSEFQRQSRDFAAAVQAKGKSVQLLVGENYNHFEMRETLASPFGLEQMKPSLG
jgi:hypothetical protein